MGPRFLAILGKALLERTTLQPYLITASSITMLKATSVKPAITTNTTNTMMLTETEATLLPQNGGPPLADSESGFQNGPVQTEQVSLFGGAIGQAGSSTRQELTA